MFLLANPLEIYFSFKSTRNKFQKNSSNFDMHHPLTKLISPGISSPTGSVKISPTNAKLPSSGEGMIKALDSRFRKIYDRVIELRSRKGELNIIIDQTQNTIETETLNQAETLDRLRKEISKVMVKNNELTLLAQQARESEGPSLVGELNQRNKQISDLADQMKTVVESLKRETTRTENLEKQILILKKENIDIESFFNKPRKSEGILEDKNLSTFPKYKNLLSKSGASGFKSSNQRTHSNELDALLNISPKSQRKGRDIENLENRLKETVEVNSYLRQENEKLKKNIMSNMHSDYEKPVYAVQNTDRETVEHAKKQQKLKISKLFADEDKLISHISHHSRDGVITHSEDEYIKKKDAQNEENFRRILEIKELERLQDQISQQDTYIRELERNAHERENLLVDRKREAASMEDNLRNFDLDIQKNLVEKDLLEATIREKKLNVEEMKYKLEDAIKNLPEDVRPRIKESVRGGIERGSFSHMLATKATAVDNDDDLEDLLKKTPKALDVRKF